MFQFMKANKAVTATAAVIIILVVALVTGFVTQHPVITAGVIAVGFAIAITGFYNEVKAPRSSK